MPEPIRRMHARSEAPVVPMNANVNIRSVALTVLAFAATMYLLHWAQEAFIPIVLSILISYALEPIVTSLTRAHIPRFIAAGLVVLATGSVLAYGAYSLSDDATAIVAQLPEAAQRLRRSMQRDRTPGAIEQVKKAAEDLARIFADIMKKLDREAGHARAVFGTQFSEITDEDIDNLFTKG